MGQKKQIIISKEDSVFWMDENGVWRNEHGRFEHPKIIRYFNASIARDDKGYYVYQATDEFEEKVYFPYEETAVFVVDVKIRETVQLVLNSMKTAAFEDGRLFSRNDNLYLDTGDHLIKFTSQALIKLSRYMKDQDGHMILDINGRLYPVQSDDD